MLSAGLSHSQSPPAYMTKPSTRSKTTSFSDGVLLLGGALVAFLTVWTLWSFLSPNPNSNPTFPSTPPENTNFPTGSHDPPRTPPQGPTFYDDPTLTYSVGHPLKNWDEKRLRWREFRPQYPNNRVVLLTGSQPSPCKNPIGDHLLLRFFKNKVDYARIHGFSIFYNNVLLHPKMHTFWAKIPVLRAAMVAHPEAEWVYWVDSDAAFTDMEFKIPFDRYKNHNLVVHGWLKTIYEDRSWVGLNAGVFLIRNCQWSMDLLEVWARMGPGSPEYDKWGKKLRETLSDKLYPESDDQSGLIYLLLKEKKKWGDKIYVEGEYYFEGYWLEIVGTFDNITEKYLGIEKGVRALRRRHAEIESGDFATVREEHIKDVGYGKGSWRRPFITHFTGCQPCSGKHNDMYEGTTCWDSMQRALNFADNQVLRSYGFMHPDLLDSGLVTPVPFDFPARGI